MLQRFHNGVEWPRFHNGVEWPRFHNGVKWPRTHIGPKVIESYHKINFFMGSVNYIYNGLLWLKTIKNNENQDIEYKQFKCLTSLPKNEQHIVIV